MTTAIQEAQLKEIGEEAKEVEMMMLHAQRAVQMHRKFCITKDGRGCGIERRLTALFDAVFQMKCEYTHAAAMIITSDEAKSEVFDG